MKSNIKIKDEISLLSSLRSLSEAYQQISVLRMQQIRQSVLSTRDYLEELSEVFVDVKQAFLHMEQEVKDRNEKSKSAVIILFSPNAKLYGEVVNKVFGMFLNNIKSSPESDIIIVGKSGKQFVDSLNLGKNYTYFEIPDFGVNLSHLKDLSQVVSEYKSVEVYFGKFINIASQEGAAQNLTGEKVDKIKGSAAKEANLEKEYAYLFEPTADQILNFFESQVFVSLLKQTVHEGELARFASRINAMENALDNISKYEKKLKMQSIKIKKMHESKKQHEIFSGINLWGGAR